MNIILFSLTVLPSIGLLIYARNKDNYSSIPVPIITKAIIFGSIMVLPAFILETVFSYSCSFVFYNSTVYTLINSFFGAGLIEETVKFVVLHCIATKYDKYFKTTYDGIIFSICSAIGFAILEDIIYVFIYYGGDLSTAIARAVTPGHFCFSIFMGILYSEAKKYERYNDTKYDHLLILSIIIPATIHGLYDFCLFMNNIVYLLIFLFLLIFLYTYAFKQIKRKSKEIFFI